jgi:LmbE family N-acetylglucosaminyl deacetylase
VRRVLGTSLVLLIGAAGPALGQFSPPGTGGVAALAGALKQLGATKRVLMIGAHPDDEYSDLVALFARGMGAQVAYLSLTRGEGGQNLIGPELGPELGVIRSEELLAARRIDGARQFFARAYDFGYSKTIDEALRFWARDSLLRDVLDVVRRFRPQIIVSVFSGTPKDGHGQHQVAGVLARQAFEALRDSSWGPVKLYRSLYFDTAAATLRLDAGVIDPVEGRSYHQIAMAGRSQHRSQDEGQLERPGSAIARLAFIEWKDRTRTSDGNGFFAGVDTVLAGKARYAAIIDSARARLDALHPSAIVPLLARALHELAGADSSQQAILTRALLSAAGVVVDGFADDGIVVPGERVQVEAAVWNAGDSTIGLGSIDVAGPDGWRVERLDAAASPLTPGALVSRHFAVTVAPDAPRSQPYFLRRPLLGALYDWSGVPADWRGLPFEPEPLQLTIRLTVAGEHLAVTRDVVYRYRDQSIGEVRRPIFVTRPFDVAVTPDLVVWPLDGATSGGGGGPRHFTVTVTNRTRGAAAAQVVLTPPAGWATVPPESLSFQREDEAKSLTVTLALPATVKPGVYQLRAAALGPGRDRSEGALAIIDYPHIRPRAVSHPSTAEVRVARITLPALSRVGYVRGASDRVPEALQAVGVPIELLGPDTLARGDLSQYDAIVIGSRAYETDPALVAANGRLLDYARAGGLVIVQYQQYPFVSGSFAPYRLSIARPHDRVTDETAAVTVLDPKSPVFHVPNEIGADDWRGWVQERGLYFAHDWDPAYTPLLEMHDPGEAPLQGGLLVAPLDKGTYVYTGLSFFRQLPAGVPGAYRLFANLLALRKR